MEGSVDSDKTHPPPRKVMVVVDSSRESAGALQYTLSHVIMEQDELILVHVENPNAWKNPFATFLRRPSLSSTSMTIHPEGGTLGEVDYLEEMRKLCELAHPKTSVRVERLQMEANNKAAAILSRSEMLGIDLLIIGQRRSLSNALSLAYKRPGGGSLRGAQGMDTAEYLIENSRCNCVGVQKKGQNAGFVLNTKSHRNFWLLA